MSHPTHLIAKYLGTLLGTNSSFFSPRFTMRPPCSHCNRLNITWRSQLDRNLFPVSCFHEIWERSVAGKHEGMSTKGLVTALGTANNIVPVMCFYLSVQHQEYAWKLRRMRQQRDRAGVDGAGAVEHSVPCVLFEKGSSHQTLNAYWITYHK